MPNRTEVISVREPYQGSLRVILIHFLRFFKGNFSEVPFRIRTGDLSKPRKYLKSLNMLSIQSDLAKYYCLYIQGVVAFKRWSFLNHPI